MAMTLAEQIFVERNHYVIILNGNVDENRIECTCFSLREKTARYLRFQFSPNVGLSINVSMI